ncbi:hypothetical protein AAMO2058_000649000 [Amorphochlora amoebiformis]
MVDESGTQGSWLYSIFCAAVPFAWLALPAIPKARILTYTPTVVVCVLLSLFLQPTSTLLVLVGLIAYTVGSYNSAPVPPPRAYDVKVEGKEDGEILFFMHGWPDNSTVWSKNVEFFRKEYKCITFTLPNFNDREPARKVNPWGYDEDHIVASIAITLKQQLKAAGKDKVVLVSHDWGAIFAASLVLQHPEMIKSVVYIDVKKDPLINSFILNMVFGFVYMYWIILAFLIQGLPYIGEPIADYMIGSMSSKMSVGRHPPRDIPATAACGYPYFYMHLRGFQEKLGILRPFKARHGITNLPQVKTLFIYAKDKPFMFHLPKAEKELKERKDGSKVVGIGEKKEGEKPKIGHWLQYYGSDIFNEELDNFLKDPN